jgi:hypothetical protein
VRAKSERRRGRHPHGHCRSPVGLSWPIPVQPSVWTAMGSVIVPDPPTPRKTGPRLRSPGPSRAPQGAHATHSHPGAATATRLPFLTPHGIPKHVDCHGQRCCSRLPHTPTNGTTAAAAAASSPCKPSVFRKVPLDSFSMFTTNRIIFFFRVSLSNYYQPIDPHNRKILSLCPPHWMQIF